MDKIHPRHQDVKTKVLLLTEKGRAVEFLTDAQDMKFTGEFIEVRNYGPEFDSEAKAVFTRPLMGGAYLKAGRQPEEAHELARRHPGRSFVFGQPLELRARQGVER